MSNQKINFVLVGPLKGKTLSVNGRPFVDGELEVEGSEQELQGLTNLFSYYGALPEADAALHDALGDGNDKPVIGSKDPPATTDPVKPTLAEAIGMLDADDDDHWTSANLPSIEFLTETTGHRHSRAEVDAVAEGFTRAKAKALQD